MPLLVGLDLGTTSIKSVVYDSDTGQIRSQSSRPTPVHHPLEGWSEHDPQTLWQDVCDSLREACAGLSPIAGLGIASMAEAGLPLGSDGAPLDHAIAWFDRRSEPQTEQIEQTIPAQELYAITGQRVSPSFGLTKLMWLEQNRRNVVNAMRVWLPLPAYILYRLTGETCVDTTIASRSLLFDQNMGAWSPRLAALANITPEQLPTVLPGSAPAGRITAAAARECGLPVGVVCAPGSHDHLCAALTAGAFQPGRLVDSCGTAQALVQILPRFLPDPRLAEHGFACYAHVLPEQYVLKAGLKAAGGAIEWLARLLSGPDRQPNYTWLEQNARAGVGQRSGPLWLPHLLESGSPEADRASRAALVGARMGHDAGDLFRGMLESLAFWLRHNLTVMAEYAGTVEGPAGLIGGLTRLSLLSELKAHILNQPVLVPELPEAAAVGAALLGGLACGVFTSGAEAAASIRYPHRRIDPDHRLAIWYDRLYREQYQPLYPALKEINQGFQNIR
jgi:xylulokinase